MSKDNDWFFKDFNENDFDRHFDTMFNNTTKLVKWAWIGTALYVLFWALVIVAAIVLAFHIWW